MQNEFTYGCIPSKVDVRDYEVKCAGIEYQLPETLELSMPPVKNQKNIKSCVAHAMSTILEYHDLEVGANKLSTNFIYGLQLKLLNDSTPGMTLSCACKIVNKYGDMLYKDCPGNIEMPECANVAGACFEDSDKLCTAQYFKIDKYFKCTSDEDIKYALYTYGPLLASIKWYKNYSVDDNGVLVGDEDGEFGYHAVVIYGYNEQGYLCQNSWGTRWGKKGRFIFPYDKSFRDIRGIVDHDSGLDDIKKRPTNKLLDVIYKLINYIINLFHKEK